MLLVILWPLTRANYLMVSGFYGFAETTFVVVKFGKGALSMIILRWMSAPVFTYPLSVRELHQRHQECATYSKEMQLQQVVTRHGITPSCCFCSMTHIMYFEPGVAVYSRPDLITLQDWDSIHSKLGSNSQSFSLAWKCIWTIRKKLQKNVWLPT